MKFKSKFFFYSSKNKVFQKYFYHKKAKIFEKFNFVIIYQYLDTNEL